MPILSIMRDAGQNPSIVRITTTETLAEITAPEYLKTQIEAIQRVNFGPFEWVDGDLVSIDYEDGEGFFAYDSVNQTFVQSGGGGGAPENATYLTQTANADLPNAQAMGSLTTGLVKNTAGTGVQTIAQPGLDYVAPNADDSIDVGGGGTGVTQTVPYTPIVGGTDPTSPLQSVASTGAAGEVLTSNGPGELPTFQSVGGGANQSLSNLTSPTAINQDLIPGGFGTFNLGGEFDPFQHAYVSSIRSRTGVLFSVWNSTANAWQTMATMAATPAPTFRFSGPTTLVDGSTFSTPAPGDNSHKLADTAFVQQELASFAPNVTWGDINGTLSNQTDLQNALNSKADTSSLGDYATLLCNLNAVVDPTAGDDSGDGYDIGSRWINVNTNKEFVCVDDAVGSAVWEETTGGAPSAPDWGDIGGTLSNQTDLQNALNNKVDNSDLGDYATIKCNLSATVDPTSGDDSGDGYEVGSRWINTANDKEFVCVDATASNAIWTETTSGGAPFDRYTYEAISSSSSLQMRSSISSGGIRNIYLPTSETGTHTYTFTQSSGNAQIPLSNTGIITNMSANNGNFMPTRASTTFPFENNLVGTFRTPYALMYGSYVFPYGCRGIDDSKVGVAAVPDRIYLVPMLVRSESLFFSFGVESITGTMSVLIRPYEMNGNVLADNVAGNVAANVVSMTVSSPGIYTFTSPSIQVRGLFWIAIQVTGSNTMSLAGCIEEDAGALAPFLGCTAKNSASPVFGFYIDGFGLISSSMGLNGITPDGVLTSGIGICAEKN